LKPKILNAAEIQRKNPEPEPETIQKADPDLPEMLLPDAPEIKRLLPPS